VKIRTQFLIFVGLVAVAVGANVMAANASRQAPPAARVEGAWYVDTLGAPFTPHLFAFHPDGILHITFPDAAERTNSAGMGIGVWERQGSQVRGKFLENNADKATNLFTSNLIVTFMLTLVSADQFLGQASASYYDARGRLMQGPFPATLKGQRITFDSLPPVVATS